MSKTIRNESTGRHELKARINAMRGFKPMTQRELDRMRERAFAAVYATAKKG